MVKSTLAPACSFGFVVGAGHFVRHTSCPRTFGFGYASPLRSLLGSVSLRATLTVRQCANGCSASRARACALACSHTRVRGLFRFVGSSALARPARRHNPLASYAGISRSAHSLYSPGVLSAFPAFGFWQLTRITIRTSGQLRVGYATILPHAAAAAMLKR